MGRGLGKDYLPLTDTTEDQDRKTLRAGKAGNQILVVAVFDTPPKPSVAVKPICGSFAGAFLEDLQGVCL